MGNPSDIYTNMENKYYHIVACTIIIDCGLIELRFICGESWWKPWQKDTSVSVTIISNVDLVRDHDL